LGEPFSTFRARADSPKCLTQSRQAAKREGAGARTDSYPFAANPKRGHKVKIVEMDSCMMRVDGQPGLSAKRRI
jgi:hypothetical protein